MGRVKDTHNHGGIDLEGLSPEMQAFRQELEQKFPNIRYTSGKREASEGVGKYSNTSHHNTGNALDIGAEHKEVYEYLWNDPEGLALLNKHGLGLINETDPETMKKTGATGAHYHIGKDSKYVAEANKRYAELSGNTQGQVQQQEDGSFVYIPSTHGYSEIPTTLYVDFTKDLEKEKKKEEKAQEEEKTEEVTEIEQAREVASKLFTPQEQEQPKQKEGQQAPEIKTDFIDMPDVATSLPSLPSIVTLPQAEDGGMIMDPFDNSTDSTISYKRKYFADGGSYGEPPYVNTAGPRAETTPQDTSWYEGMVRAKIAMENEQGNPAAKRLINAPDEPYVFSGREVDRGGNPLGVPEGELGTHFMGSYGEYAIPEIQMNTEGKLEYVPKVSPTNREAMRFNSDEEAQYFAENYKRNSPAFFHNIK